MYADKMTDSMRVTIEETTYRREKQMNYNLTHGITPQPLHKKIENPLSKSPITEFHYENTPKKKEHSPTKPMSRGELEKEIQQTRKLMEAASKELDFIQAAHYRDLLKELQEKLQASSL